MNPPQGHEALLKPNKPMSTTAVEPLLLRIRQDVGAWNNPSLPTPEFLRVGHWRVPPSPLMQAFNSEGASDANKLEALRCGLTALREFWWRPERQYNLKLKCPECKKGNVARTATTCSGRNRSHTDRKSTRLNSSH